MKDGKVDRFKVDENGLTVDGYRCLEPESKRSMYLGNAITVAISAAIVLLIAMYGDSWLGDYHDIACIGLYVLLAVIVIYELIEPQITYMRYRYRMDEDKIDIRRGIVYITHEMVPIERVHQVDVNVGPINRAFGLADVGITTAGGEVKIQFLKEDVAESIASKLNDKIVRMLKERV